MRRRGRGRGQVGDEHVVEHLHREAHAGVDVRLGDGRAAALQAVTEGDTQLRIHWPLVDVLLDLGGELRGLREKRAFRVGGGGGG